MIDAIEAAEAMIERWVDEHVRGDNFQCGCGVWIPIDGGFYTSANPHAPPVCFECARIPLEECSSHNT